MPWRHGAQASGLTQSIPLIQIENAIFRRHFPSPNTLEASNPPLFPSLSFAYSPAKARHWAVIAPSNYGKTTFFEILRGKHICVPPSGRSFPYLSSPWIDQAYRNPLRTIQHVGFDGESGNARANGSRGAYLSARYESRREDDDFTLRAYMLGKTELNALVEKEGVTAKESLLGKVVNDFKLESLMDMPMSNLSNGQTRRARIAKAILGQPMVLLLDEPFMGLDPPTVRDLSNVLFGLSSTMAPDLILSLRPQDPCPEWINHVVYLDEPLRMTGVGGKKRESQSKMRATTKIDPPSPLNARAAAWTEEYLKVFGTREDRHRLAGKRSRSTEEPSSDLAEQSSKREVRLSDISWEPLSKEGLSLKPVDAPASGHGEILMSMQGVEVKYGDKIALGGWQEKEEVNQSPLHGRGMWWEVRRGQHWGVFGSNGSGKTTLISLICSDHPQAYSQPLEIFGRSRLPQRGSPGISIFDIQARIGQSSPEIHAFFPKHLTLRQTLMSAWAETFLGPPNMTTADHATVDAVLRWFASELNPAAKPEKSPAIRRKVGSIPIEPPLFESLRDLHSVAWADNVLFGQSPFSVQRVALFLRAIIRKSDLIVLDEAFSGMDATVRNTCMAFLTHGEAFAFNPNQRFITSRSFVKLPDEVFHGRPRITGLSDEQALICISHVKEEVPGVVRHWLRLPEPNSGEGPQFGALDRPLESDDTLWKTIWGI